MAPIIIFFYQLYIHSWIRNNGPRDVEYIVVECQILLAIILSSMAAFFWAVGHVIPYVPQIIPKTGQSLDLANPGTSDHITKTHIVTGTTVNAGGTGGPNVTATIESSNSTQNEVTVTIKYIKVTLSSGGPITAKPGLTVQVQHSGQPAKTATVKATVAPAGSDNKSNVTITIDDQPVYEKNVSGADVKIQSLYLAIEHTGAITVKEESAGTVSGGSGTPTETTVLGYAYIANKGYYINEISGGPGWHETWEGEKCLYAACYYNGPSGTEPALLMLHVLGNTLTTKYYGKDNGSTWRKIDANKFNDKLNSMITSGTFTELTASDGEPANPSHNTNFSMVLFDPSEWKWWPPWEWKLENPSQTWLPLLMQGLSVGAVGSIFPNLIPKTLALNAALDATELVALLRAYHAKAQVSRGAGGNEENYQWYGLNLKDGKIRNNLTSGVLEATVSKIKSIKFATEAAITILRIDDFITLEPEKQPVEDDD